MAFQGSQSYTHNGRKWIWLSQVPQYELEC